MERTIFYSWQSDLPNSTNRGFIESCLKKAIKNLKKSASFELDLSIDRDTRNITGTPDIIDSIFTKISRSKIFVADVSIINSTSQGRKCPNPNVLIELGFAARVLGWERVFCVYNLDYGTIEDLPFDLRQRRPILYSIDKTGKEECRTEIVKILTSSIISLQKNGGLFDKVDDYVKMKVDTEILTITGHLGKMLFGYTGKSVLESTHFLLNLTDDEIEHYIKNGEFIGFQVFKNFSYHEEKFRKMADSAISSKYHDRELAAIMIDLVNWVGRFDALNSIRNNDQWFKKSSEIATEYTLLPPKAFQKNDELPNRFVLLKNLQGEKGIVIDFGDFPYKERVQELLIKQRFKAENIKTFVSVIRHFIDIVDSWLGYTNGELILDTYHNFEIKSTKDN